MMIRQIAPESGDVELPELLDRLADPANRWEPFGEPILAFCDALAQKLFRDPNARELPELQALAFWLRRASTEKLRQGFAALKTPDTRLAARGLVFHVTPTNVETIFVYSWITALLCGNTNLVRLSQRSSPPRSVLERAIAHILADDKWEGIRRGTALVTYDHDSECTAAISARSDVRMLWGGDRTVATIKAVPTSLSGKDLAFIDRQSFAVIRAERFLALGPEHKRALLRDFFNDSYWFGQMGCSSPRSLFWIGEEATCTDAAERFAEELAAVLSEKQFVNDTSAALEVMNFAFVLAARERRVRLRRISNELTLADCGLPEEPLDSDHCGHGFFRNYRMDDLDRLVPLVSRKDQTMTQFGLEIEEVEELVRRLAGRGLERVVPFGSALAFGRYWDGYDLFQELTRRVFVATTGRRAEVIGRSPN